MGLAQPFLLLSDYLTQHIDDTTNYNNSAFGRRVETLKLRPRSSTVQDAPMSRWTKRPQNSCRRCNYLWYPRGKDVSSSCPRCGSGDVELAIMALFRAIAGLVVVLFVALKGLLGVLAALVWRLTKCATATVRNLRTRFTKGLAPQSIALPTTRPPSRSRTSLPPRFSSRPSTPAGWAPRMRRRLYDSVTSFFSWIASVNDDLTGDSENSSPLAILTKLFVLFALAGLGFMVTIAACRLLGLI